MLKIFFFCILLWGLVFISLAADSIKINELFYDPVGADTGYEWIELYNAGTEAVDLENWQIESAGTTFQSVFTFPQIEIAAAGYLLIGEAMVPGCHLYTTLAFQNGGGATDGVRIVAPGGYTDTVLYDTPNGNNLPSDLNDPGIYFAPDISSGNSLARYQDGVDTDNCAEDWFESNSPTPNAANFYPIDLEITDLEIYQIADIHYLSTRINNLSTQAVDNSAAELQIRLDGNQLASSDLPAIAANSGYDFQYELGEFLEGYYSVEVEVNYIYDNNIENNIVTSGFLVGDSPIIINELLYKDSATSTE
ncbi:MAG: lamin tail domain-containing protein, partial [Candidatus Cloacimonadales bacterium]